MLVGRGWDCSSPADVDVSEVEYNCCVAPGADTHGFVKCGAAG